MIYLHLILPYCCKPLFTANSMLINPYLIRIYNSVFPSVSVEKQSGIRSKIPSLKRMNIDR